MNVTENILKEPFQFVLLADDDMDDCFLFKNAIKEITPVMSILDVHDGEELMKLLHSTEILPDVLFLDLNMPRKNGLACLTEIKQSIKLTHLPVVVVSTGSDEKVIDLIYESGAFYYIRKPNEFSLLKKLILKALTLLTENKSVQPSRNSFVLS